jgi:hypothetical protein
LNFNSVAIVALFQFGFTVPMGDRHGSLNWKSGDCSGSRGHIGSLVHRRRGGGSVRVLPGVASRLFDDRCRNSPGCRWVSTALLSILTPTWKEHPPSIPKMLIEIAPDALR